MTKKAAELLSASGASIVDIDLSGKVKEVTVVVPEKGLPRFLFKGDWTGRDIHVLKRHIDRAYYMRNREIRREFDKATKLLEPKLEGAKDA